LKNVIAHDGRVCVVTDDNVGFIEAVCDMLTVIRAILAFISFIILIKRGLIPLVYGPNSLPARFLLRIDAEQIKTPRECSQGTDFGRVLYAVNDPFAGRLDPSRSAELF
jgi:hypothetical protein